jgi:hypothetical protein
MQILCGYELSKDKKRHIKITRKRMKDILGGLKKLSNSFKEKKKQNSLYK